MILKSTFKPARFLSGQHLQTLYPTLFKNRILNSCYQTELQLPDGDFVDLCWNEAPQADDRRPVVVVFHGLEGSIRSPYAQHIMQALKQRNWNAVLMHFRGCSGRKNRLPRAYHSGDTADARYFIENLRQSYPGAPLFAIGYSLGGNMLLKLQAEYGENSQLTAAASVCAPIELNKCADRIDKGFSKVYQRHLMKRLVTNLLRKFDDHDYKSLINLPREEAAQLKTFWEFDHRYTAPVHGFDSASDYYEKSSARQYLGEITHPTLMLQAVDDPFMTPDVIPAMDELGSGVTLEVSESGGHVGFVEGSIMKPRYWLPERICDYFSDYL